MKNEKQFSIDEIKTIIEEAKSKTLSSWGYVELEAYFGLNDFEKHLIETFESKFEK